MLSTSEFQVGFKELVASHPRAFVTEETESVWLKKFANKDSRLFGITIDRLTENEDFPGVGQALNLYKAIQQSESSRPTTNVFVIPKHVMEMTDAECEADYQNMKSFFDAYPYPDTPPGATEDELMAIERGYHRRMGQAGINPKEATNPKVGARLMAALMSSWSVTSPGQSRGNWKDSLKRYERIQGEKDITNIKRLAMEGWG